MLAGVVCAGSASGQEIRVWPTGATTESTVRLRDVAMIRGLDAKLAKELGELTIRSGAGTAGEVVVGADDIRTALSDARWNMAEVTISGSSRCIVRKPKGEAAAVASATPKGKATRMTTTRPPAAHVKPATHVAASGGEQPEYRAPGENTLENAVRRYLQGRVASQGGRVSVRFSSASREVLSAGGPDAKFEIQMRDGSLPGLVGLDVTILRAEQQPEHVSVSVDASVTRAVVVARRGLNQGSIIKAGDVETAERTFSKRDDAGITDLSSVVGREVRSFVRAGDQLRARDLRDAPMVRRGDLVTLWTRRGGLVIKSAGRAAGSGSLGDLVPIRVEGSAEMIQGSVTGPKTVTVEGTTQVAAK